MDTVKQNDMNQNQKKEKKYIPFSEIVEHVRRGSTIQSACKKVGLFNTSRFYKHAPDQVKAEILGLKTANAKSIPTKAPEMRVGSSLARVFRPSDISEDDD